MMNRFPLIFLSFFSVSSSLAHSSLFGSFYLSLKTPIVQYCSQLNDESLRIDNILIYKERCVSSHFYVWIKLFYQRVFHFPAVLPDCHCVLVFNIVLKYINFEEIVTHSGCLLFFILMGTHSIVLLYIGKRLS